MLSFDIRALAAHAVQVDDVLDADDSVWQMGDPQPAEPVRVTGRLSTAGPDRYYFSGRFEGSVAGECRRCLTELRADVSEDVHLIFAEEGDETVDEDPDVYALDPRQTSLDLRPALREHWLLAVPTYAECREDCKGLCPTCGTDLNAGDCDCAPVVADSRWEALRSLRTDSK
jgi:uncharacterized protein